MGERDESRNEPRRKSSTSSRTTSRVSRSTRSDLVRTVVPTITDSMRDQYSGAARAADGKDQYSALSNQHSANAASKSSRSSLHSCAAKCDNSLELPMNMSQALGISPEVVREHVLTPEEYEKIKQLLGGREPTVTELGIFSVMWSEHCSYKSSRVHLKRLPTRSRRVVQGPGENAGIIDLGDGWACAFKIESHNHPSFIEPFQGAATGVGGILRDIFTMGARPLAVMDSLRFGPLDEAGPDEGLRRRDYQIATGVGDGGGGVA